MGFLSQKIVWGLNVFADHSGKKPFMADLCEAVDGVLRKQNSFGYLIDHIGYFLGFCYNVELWIGRQWKMQVLSENISGVVINWGWDEISRLNVSAAILSIPWIQTL